MKKGMKIFGDIIFYGVLGILIVFLLIGSISKKSTYGFAIGKYRTFDILTGSMTPTINPGSLIVVKEINPSKIEENDIVTFKSDITNNVTTHRVINIDSTNGKLEFETKGDANNAPDPVMLEANNIIGKVIFKIPSIGGIIRSIQENKAVIIGIVTFVLLLSIILKKLNFKKNYIDK